MTGCASEPQPRIDEDTAELVVARGYVVSGELYRWPTCAGPPEFLEIVNCVPGRRSSLRFRVEEPVVGVPRRGDLRVTFGYAPYLPEISVGPDTRYLAVFLTDGRRYEMQNLAAVSQTDDGSWAIPVTFDQQTVDFPCSKDDGESEPLGFRSPRPREPASPLELRAQDVEQLADEGSFTLEDDGYLYANMGVPVKHAGVAYAGKSARQVAGECP